MFEHSVKVPRLYKLAGNIVRQIKEEGGSLKSLVFQEKNKHYNVQALYALVFETVRHDVELGGLFTKTGLFTKETRLDPWLARVLATEMLWGKQKKLEGQCKPIQTLNQYYNQFLSLLDPIPAKPVQNDIKEVLKPRYVRVNTLRLSAADAVRSFQDDGWNLVRCTAGAYDAYLQQVENLQPYDFVPDYHVKTVFVFAPNTPFYDSPLYQNGEIFLQDKATCLAAHLLSPEPGSTVLDMCAAPGMKTTQLAALMKNEGTIYSIEMDETRYNVLCEFVESAGATCVKVMNRDVTTVTKDDCPNVDYILLDPSCSGSGIHRAESNDPKYDLESGRVKKLSSFQAKLLRYALNEFSTAKRVIYSTCSLYPQENEEVIQDVLANHKGNFKLVSVKERLNNNWNNLGDLKYKGIGENCLYARPESDHTSGFFLATFERFEKPKELCEDKSIENVAGERMDVDIVENKKRKRKKKIGDDEVNEIEGESVSVDNVADGKCEEIRVEVVDGKKKKKQRKSNYESVEGGVSADKFAESELEEKELKINKKKKRVMEEDFEVNNELNEETAVNDEGVEKKKKKHSKKEDVEVVLEINEGVGESVIQKDKKEKKRKKEKSDLGELQDTEELCLKTEEKIKKKKRVEDVTSVEIITEEEGSSKKKKKR